MDIIDHIEVMERLDRIEAKILGGMRVEILDEVRTYRTELKQKVNKMEADIWREHNAL